MFSNGQQIEAQLPLQQHDQPGLGHIVALMGSWHMKLQLLAAFLDARQESCSTFPVANLRGEPLDDCLPIRHHQIRAWKCPSTRDFHIAFRPRERRSALPVSASVLVQNSSSINWPCARDDLARQARRTGRRIKRSVTPGNGKTSGQDDKHHPLPPAIIG